MSHVMAKWYLHFVTYRHSVRHVTSQKPSYTIKVHESLGYMFILCSPLYAAKAEINLGKPHCCGF